MACEGCSGVEGGQMRIDVSKVEEVVEGEMHPMTEELLEEYGV